jgi:aspartyl/asparaginyl-tRNA synthetase
MEVVMKPKSLLLACAVHLVFLNLACDAANSFTSTKIKDILDHPRDYENKEITIYGTVTNAVSLLFVKYFEIQDDTGTIKVVTDKLLPAKGKQLRVTGRMAVVEIGTDRWVMLQEKSEPSNQAGKSSNYVSAGNLKE